MAKKSKRGQGPRPGSNRAERMAARKARQAEPLAGPSRPFEALPAAECDLVALRAFVSAATAQVTWAKGFKTENEADFATILPGAVPGIIRSRDGAIWGEKGGNKGDADGKVTQGLVALQTDPEPTDLTGSLASALVWAAEAKPGDEYVPAKTELTLDKIVDPKAPLDVSVYGDFKWWFADDAELSPQITAMLDRANQTILPTTRMRAESGIGAPWWVDAGDKAHVRWVRPEAEDDLMDALARLNVAGDLNLGEGSRFAGSFRTHGLLVPVFDLDPELHAREWEDGLNKFDDALTKALKSKKDLTPDERGARRGLIARQVTLRV